MVIRNEVVSQGEVLKPDSSTKVMTSQEVCAFLKIPLSTLYGLTKAGKIKGVKVGKHWRYLESEVYDYVARPSVRLRPFVHLSVDQRHSPRINCELRATTEILLSRKTCPTVNGTILNLSKGGALFSIEENANSFQIGDPVRIAFGLSGPLQQSIKADGRIVHINSFPASSSAGARAQNRSVCFGVKFREISKEEEGAIEAYVG